MENNLIFRTNTKPQHDMKAIKIILILLGVIALLAIIGIVMSPSEMDMTRSTSINASKDVVWNNIKSLQAMDAWTPWMEMDPEAEGGFEGPEGEVGSKGWWNGEVVGEGSQTISEIKEYESMKVDLEFIEDGKMVPATGTISMADSGESINVDWNFHMDFTFGDKASMMWKMITGEVSMEEMEKQGEESKQAFDKGLANLKALCENSNDVGNGSNAEYEILEVDREAVRYLGMRSIVKFEDIGDHYQSEMPKVGQTVGPMMTGPPAGIFWKWDEDNKETDMAVAGTCAEGEAEGFEAFDIEAGKALHVAYYGDYAGSEGAHMALNKHLEENGIEFRDVVIEEYITDPGTEPDTSKWLTNIYYMIKE